MIKLKSQLSRSWMLLCKTQQVLFGGREGLNQVTGKCSWSHNLMANRKINESGGQVEEQIFGVIFEKSNDCNIFFPLVTLESSQFIFSSVVSTVLKGLFLPSWVLFCLWFFSFFWFCFCVFLFFSVIWWPLLLRFLGGINHVQCYL